jgi:hypothetical protein
VRLADPLKCGRAICIQGSLVGVQAQSALAEGPFQVICGRRVVLVEPQAMVHARILALQQVLARVACLKGIILHGDVEQAFFLLAAGAYLGCVVQTS